METYSRFLNSIGGDASLIPTTGIKSWIPDLNNINQIKLFQKSMGLKPDGIVGQKTAKVFMDVYDMPVNVPIVQNKISSGTNNTSSGKSSSSNVNKNTGQKINMNDLFKDVGTITGSDNNTAINNDNTAINNYNTGDVTSGFMNYLSNQNSPLPSSGDWKFPPSQTAQLNNQNNIAMNGDEPSTLSGFSVANNGKGYITNNLTDSGAVNGSGSNAFQKAMDLQNTLSNKWGNTSYGDAWTQGNGVLGGISNMWDKFTSPNGSMANPTPSGAENFLKSLGGVGTFAGGVADLMYKSKLADLMGRQVSQQEALQNATLKSKNDWEKSYAGSFK